MTRKSRFLWPALLLLAALACLGGGAWEIYGLAGSKGLEFQGPGEARVTIAEPGTRTLWIFTRTMIDGTVRHFPNELPDGTRIEAERLADGARMEVRAHRSSQVTVNDHERRSVARIEFEQAGEHEIRVSGLDEERLFRLSEGGFARSLFRSMALMAGAVLLGMGGVIWLVVAALQRAVSTPPAALPPR